jgi:hypothetical protein
MSSHREAPEISKDPVADSTDLYAFVDPNHPTSVTIIANYIPLEEPAGGPNFNEFGDDVRYEINISNRPGARDDVTYRFRFTTHVRNPNTFLYNTGPVTDLHDENLNRFQTYSLTRRTRGGGERVLLRNAPVAPANIGPSSTPDYAHLAQQAVRPLPGGGEVFCGPRADGFYVDLGSVFDLLTLRPFQNLHRFNRHAAQPSVNALAGYNVHTIALRVPTARLTRHGGTPDAGDVDSPASVIGVYTSASRHRAKILGDEHHDDREHGAFQQVSRLGNPLFNEVLVPMGRKDEWNRVEPREDSSFARGVLHPEVSALLPVLYPDVFPHLASYTAPRADLAAILLTGIPSGVVPGLQTFTGTRQADLLRLNVAVPPSADPKPLGVLGGDLAGYPNGRRVADDVFTIELRALAGATIPLVDPSFTPDAAAGAVTDDLAVPHFLDTFPYLDTPHDGYSAHTAAAS